MNSVQVYPNPAGNRKGYVLHDITLTPQGPRTNTRRVYRTRSAAERAKRRILRTDPRR